MKTFVQLMEAVHNRLVAIWNQVLEGNQSVSIPEPHFPPAHVQIVIWSGLALGFAMLRMFDLIPSGFGLVIVTSASFICMLFISDALKNGRKRMEEKDMEKRNYDGEISKLKAEVNELKSYYGENYVCIPERRHRKMGFQGDEKRVQAQA